MSSGCIGENVKVVIREIDKSWTRKTSIKNAYKLFIAGKKFLIKVLNGKKFIFLPVKNVLQSGVKETIRLTINGHYLDCTPDHEILTENGWKQAGDLQIGDKIVANGELNCCRCGSDKDVCKTKYGKFYGYCKKCMYLLRNGTKYKNNEIGRFVDEFGYITLHGQSLRDYPGYMRYNRSMGISEHRYVMEQYLGRMLTSDEVVHHINGNPSDNRIENLQLCTKSEHAKIHSKEKMKSLIQYNDNIDCYKSRGNIIWVSSHLMEITSIEKIGKQMTYDITINDVNIHNFVANNFVVHNCGKTLQAIVLARYKKEHRNLKHCLIVCGINSLKYNWQREVKKFCKNEKAIVLGTRINTKDKVIETTIEETKNQIDNCPEEFFWIINIEKMRVNKKDKDSIVDHLNKQIEQKNLGMIIVDEVHKIRNIDSAQATRVISFRYIFR